MSEQSNANVAGKLRLAFGIPAGALRTTGWGELMVGGHRCLCDALNAGDNERRCLTLVAMAE